MADTLFSPGTVIQPSWLNDVNTATYTILSAVSAGPNNLTANAASTVLGAYPRGVAFRFIPQATNTGPCTLNISGLGAKALTKFGNFPLVANDLQIGMWAYIAYDGVQFQLINPRTTDFLFLAGTLPVTALSGAITIANGGTGTTTIIPVGQCRLDKSGANLLLSPVDGNKLAFPAGFASIPAAGVSLAPTALAVSSNFYIYAVQTAGVVTSLEASVTVPAIDAATGIAIKTGDATRVKVGFARTITGPAWQDTAAQRFVLSWFNQRPVPTLNFFTTNRTSNSVPIVEINTEIRNEFLLWANTAAAFNVAATVSVNAAAGFGNQFIGLDGATQDGGGQFLSPNSGNGVGCSAFANFTAAEGYHYTTLMATVAGGNTGTWTGTGATARTTLQGIIQG